MKQIFEQIHRYSEMNFEEGKPFEFTLEGKRKEDNTDWLCQPVKKMEVGKSYKITVKKKQHIRGGIYYDKHSYYIKLYAVK